MFYSLRDTHALRHAHKYWCEVAKFVYVWNMYVCVYIYVCMYLCIFCACISTRHKPHKHTYTHRYTDTQTHGHKYITAASLRRVCTRLGCDTTHTYGILYTDGCVCLCFKVLRVYFLLLETPPPRSSLILPRRRSREKVLFPSTSVCIYDVVCCCIEWASGLGIGFWLRGVQPRSTVRWLRGTRRSANPRN